MVTEIKRKNFVVLLKLFVTDLASKGAGLKLVIRDVSLINFDIIIDLLFRSINTGCTILINF